MKKITVQFYSDPGHGWAKVSLDVLKKLNIADKISTFSYRKGNNVYLEEDCDCSVLIDAFKANNVTFKFVENYTNKSSKIRSYQSYFA